MRNHKIRTIGFGIIWAAQLAAEIIAAYNILKLDMLPFNWIMIVLFLALAVLAALTAILLFLPEKQTVQEEDWAQDQQREPKKGRLAARVRHIIGTILAIFIIVICLIASNATNKLAHTVSTVTEGETTEITALVGVYVEADDSASELSDLADYTFAVNTTDEDSYLPQALAYIEEATGTSVQTASYAGIVNMVNALYNQEVQAIIINEAFIDVLSELEGYTDFADKTKEIASISVVLETSIDQDTDDTQSTDHSETSSGSGSTTQAGTTAGVAEADTEEVEISQTPFLVYLSGSDTRDTMLTTSRSDVNILAAVNPNTKQVLFVNTPRDYYVANPAGNGAKDKLTHCGIYGIDCSIQALSNLYQEDIDYYGQINFTGFEKLIDAIGGVTVYSDTAFTTRHNNVDIQVGENQLDGAGALGFVRERYALSGGDNDRGQNQMKVLKAVVQKLTAGTLLTNYSEILDSLEGMFITDISSDELSGLVRMQLSDMAEWDVFTYAVTGTGGSAETYSMPGWNLYVMYPNEDTVTHATELIDRLVAGETLTDEDVG